jgi:hypothetical protein
MRFLKMFVEHLRNRAKCGQMTGVILFRPQAAAKLKLLLRLG